MKNIMPKYDLKKIIHEMQDSPALKFFREIQDSPTMKTFREMQNSPAMKAFQEMQNSPAMKAFRETQDSPAMKAFREMQNSPAMKAFQEMQNSPAMKAFRETQDSPAMKTFREMQNSPAMKAFQEMQNSPAMKAFREMQNSPAMKALSAIRASQQKSLSSIFSKNLEGQLRLGNTLGALQQHSISSVFHERMIDYVSSQPIIQDLESANVPTTSNKDNLAVNSTTTTEEKNSASIITHIILWIFISICSSPVFKKLSVDAAFDLTIAFVFEYVIKPLADELIINDSETANCNNEPVANISNQETLNQFLANKRVVTNTIDFFESPKKKSSIIESLPAGTLLTVIPDKTISKSWLKVRITLDQNEVEGYVLRRYTSPVK